MLWLHWSENPSRAGWHRGGGGFSVSYLHSDAGGALWNATKAHESGLNLDKGKATIGCTRGSVFVHVDWMFSPDGLRPSPAFNWLLARLLNDAVADH